jgi:hypothetical protein
MSNSIMVIFPYRHQHTWVFDDKHFNLVKEPFISGAPEMIDTLVQNIPDSTKGFKLLFSTSPFPGCQAELVWIKEEYEGNWYRWESENLEGWLCPALFNYFSATPERIYCKAEKLI